MCAIQTQINDLATFIRTEVYASLDDMTKAVLVRKQEELCAKYFLAIAQNLHRNKYKGCYAPHKAVMIMAIMDLVESGHITSNVINLDKELKQKFKEVWQRVVPVGSPFQCEYRNPFTYMDSEPFWTSTHDKDQAIITWEAYYAFSLYASRTAIKACLIRSIREETISDQYATESNTKLNFPDEMLGFIPLLGLLIAV